jgi:hypothetical protein
MDIKIRKQGQKKDGGREGLWERKTVIEKYIWRERQRNKIIT